MWNINIYTPESKGKETEFGVKEIIAENIPNLKQRTSHATKFYLAI